MIEENVALCRANSKKVASYCDSYISGATMALCTSSEQTEIRNLGLCFVVITSINSFYFESLIT